MKEVCFSLKNVVGDEVIRLRDDERVVTVKVGSWEGKSPYAPPEFAVVIETSLEIKE